ncbi:uncharacterized protein LOC111259588 isoform X2 [Varroa jacobsoni]|nr:uncharacterized protein LOC111251673 isoform X2 [Varroa destructor]XP_022687476.1 uncharacterized protein LOC111259588 isoform X2 [Varroa jacobsoni]
MGWIRTTMRLAVVGGAGYAACKADVWGDNKTTVNYISKQCDSCDKLKYYKALVPSCEEMRIKWADSWNGGVKTVFTFIDQLPQNTVDGVTWTVNKIQELAAIDPAHEEKPKSAPPRPSNASKSPSK